MIIIGELINTSRKSIADAVENYDESYIVQIAEEQLKAGAKYIDVNAGTRENDEEERLVWLVKTVQNKLNIPLCIDTPNHVALKAALKVHKGQAMVNSISAETDRYQQVLPLVMEHQARVVALCMDDLGIPETGEKRLEIIESLGDNLLKAGIKEEDIFFDPLVKPISVNTEAGNEVFEAMDFIKTKYPKAHISCGMSNISFGLPERKLLNRAFLILCMMKGLDAPIINPLDTQLMGLMKATHAILGQDEYSMGYIKFFRANKGNL